MIISDDRWADIIKATEAGIARWNASAAKHKKPDKFSVRISETSGYCVLLTAHNNEWRTHYHAVAREIATGQMRAVNVFRKTHEIIGYKIKSSDPKAWKSLPNKSADAAVTQLRLCDFFLPISSKMIPAETETISPVKGVA